MNNTDIMMLPRQVAKTGLLPEHAVRRLISEGKAPGIYIGNRYLVNYTVLCEMLRHPDTSKIGGATNE